MVTRHDVISSRSSYFWVVFCQLLWTIKEKLVDEMIQSAYLCYFTCQAQKIISTWFLILGKIQDSDHCWWSHRPPAALSPTKYTSSVDNIKGFPLKAKSFCNTATHLKLWGGIQSTPPCTTVGVWIWVYVRGLTDNKERINETKKFKYTDHGVGSYFTTMGMVQWWYVPS